MDRNRARVFPGPVANTGPGTWARSSLSFLSVAWEGKGLGTGGLCPNVTGTHKLHIVKDVGMWSIISSICPVIHPSDKVEKGTVGSFEKRETGQHWWYELVRRGRESLPHEALLWINKTFTPREGERERLGINVVFHLVPHYYIYSLCWLTCMWGMSRSFVWIAFTPRVWARDWGGINV
jgi:hypothetical protein